MSTTIKFAEIAAMRVTSSSDGGEQWATNGILTFTKKERDDFLALADKTSAFFSQKADCDICINRITKPQAHERPTYPPASAPDIDRGEKKMNVRVFYQDDNGKVSSVAFYKDMEISAVEEELDSLLGTFFPQEIGLPGAASKLYSYMRVEETDTPKTTLLSIAEFINLAKSKLRKYLVLPFPDDATPNAVAIEISSLKSALGDIVNNDCAQKKGSTLVSMSYSIVCNAALFYDSTFDCDAYFDNNALKVSMGADRSGKITLMFTIYSSGNIYVEYLSEAVLPFRLEMLD